MGIVAPYFPGSRTEGRSEGTSGDKYRRNYIVTLYTHKAKCSDLKPVRVPMNADLRVVLKKIPVAGDYVFTNPRTKTAHDHRDKLLRSLGDDAGVKEFTYHCLRHFTACTLDSLGVPIIEIQRILGHEKPTAIDWYLQRIGGGTRQAVAKLEGLLQPPGER